MSPRDLLYTKVGSPSLISLSLYGRYEVKIKKPRSSTYSLLHRTHLHSRDPSHRPTTGGCTDLKRDIGTLRGDDTRRVVQCDRVDSRPRLTDRRSQSCRRSASVTGCTVSCCTATRQVGTSLVLSDTHTATYINTLLLHVNTALSICSNE